MGNIYDAGAAMTWTTEKPTQPGWYWYREKGEVDKEIQKVYSYWIAPPNGGRYALATVDRGLVERLNGEWAGPLDPPT